MAGDNANKKTHAERLAAIGNEYQKLDPMKDSVRISRLLAEAATLIDRIREPKRWAAYRLMYAQAAGTVNPEAAISAYRESIPFWDPQIDRDALVDCHYELGNLLFMRDMTSKNVEDVISHL